MSLSMMLNSSRTDPTRSPDRDQLLAVDDAQRTGRMARAEEYFCRHLGNQHEWYDKKATSYKRWSQWLSLAVIAVGTLITFVQVFTPLSDADVAEARRNWALLVPTVTAALGVAVALLRGMERIWKFDETWITYRRASEKMKRERRLYINNAGSYRLVADEEEAYRLFVENTEAIVAEEQQIYWQRRADTGRQEQAGHKAKPAEGGE